jgi:hypothetical protein
MLPVVDKHKQFAKPGGAQTWFTVETFLCGKPGSMVYQEA